MLQLSSDESFHYEILRVLAHSRYFGADISEVLEAASSIEPGNFESFSNAFYALASRVNGQADQIDSSKYPISARDAYFRASNYFRAADFFLHGNTEDPRINELWEKQTAAFDKAISLLPIPGERVLLQADGFEIPAIFYRAGGDRSVPKPTLIVGNGYDGSQEEMFHVCGFAWLERGYNVITYEGPGQPSVRRQQNLGFISQWEKVVNPVMDYIVTQPEVDASHVGLWGYSMGGWLAVRAAAFEHRLAAVIAVDGVYSVFQAYSDNLPPDMQALLDQDPNKLNDIITGMLKSGKAPTSLRWGVEQGLWSFNVETPVEFMDKTKEMTLEGIADQVQCPIWIGEGEDDVFFQGQPELAREALKSRATFVKLTKADGAGTHCHIGASVLLNQIVMDWFQSVISKDTRGLLV